MAKKVCIIGAGLAGLATALRLSRRGDQVEIHEKNSNAGGRLNKLSFDDYTFDAGPSFFSMTYEFEEFAEDCSIKLPFEYIKADPLFSVNFYEDNSTYKMYRDVERLSSQFKNIEPDFEKKMTDYLQTGKSLFDNTIDKIVRRNFDSLFGYVDSLMHVDKKHIGLLLHSYQTCINKIFTSPEVRKTLSLSAYFLGNTPRKTNAVYTLLSYAEFINDGYFCIKGGMYRIVEGILKELNEDGVDIIYNSEIVGVEQKNNRIDKICNKNGAKYEADYFISNNNPLNFKKQILKRSKYSDSYMNSKKWSMGMLTIYAGIDIKLKDMCFHNYYIGKGGHSNEINNFRHFNPHDIPYYYVNQQSLYNTSAAPEGCEALMFVVPVPNIIYKSDWSDAHTIAQNIISDFSKRINIDINSHLRTLKIMTPYDWQDRFGLYKGAALGLSHTLSQTGYLRPSNKDNKIDNLFYTGSCTVPGIGLPMAIISSRLTTERILGNNIKALYNMIK